MRGLYVFIFCLASIALQAQSAPELFRQGNEAYQQEQYQEAIALYQQAVEKGKVSTALYYNLGNAYYKQNQLAEAILNYERALALSPGDDEVLHNLNLAEQKTIDRFETLPRTLFQTAYLNIVLLFSGDNWARISLWLFGIMLLGTAVYFFTGFRRTGFIAAAGGLLIGGLCLALAYAHEKYRESHREAIVMEASTYVKTGPAETAEDSFILHEGTKAVVIEEFEGWQKIRLPDGKIGWVPASDIELI